MKLSRAISQYVAYRRSSGVQYQVGDNRLKRFLRSVGDIDLEHIDSDAVWAFLAKQGRIDAQGIAILSTLRGFYQFLLAREYVTCSPLPVYVSCPPSTFKPHIYTPEELARLIAATDVLEKRWDPMRAPTFRTLLILLYGAGLRIGEAMRLTVADVNLPENLLTVRKSKFYKTRWVPVCPELAGILKIYFQKRKRWHRPVRGDSAFFATGRTPSLNHSYVQHLFNQVRKQAGLDQPDTGGFRPRLHDLRHTSAVHRLLTWYREGKDIHALLPYLAIYLGHLKLSGTQRYLTMTPELLKEANARFEHYVCLEINHA